MTLPKLPVVKLTDNEIASFATGQAVERNPSLCNLDEASLTELAKCLTLESAQNNTAVLKSIIMYSSKLRQMPDVKRTLEGLLPQPSNNSSHGFFYESSQLLTGDKKDDKKDSEQQVSSNSFGNS